MNHKKPTLHVNGPVNGPVRYEQLTEIFSSIEEINTKLPRGVHFPALKGRYPRPTAFFRVVHSVLLGLRKDYALYGDGGIVVSDAEGRFIGTVEDVPIERRLQLYSDICMLVTYHSASIESEVPASVWVTSRDGFCNFLLSMTHDEAVGLLRLHELAE